MINDNPMVKYLHRHKKRKLHPSDVNVKGANSGTM